MCLTWRHDFGLGEVTEFAGMTEASKTGLRLQMRQIYEHHVLPAIMNAKADAFIEIAEMVDVFADTAAFSAMNVESPSEIAAFRIEEGALRGTAAAVRNRGDAITPAAIRNRGAP